MDQSTHNIRRNSWIDIIRQCHSRPADMTVKTWLEQNGISKKSSYYYWLRKFRKEAYEKLLPSAREPHTTDLAFAELQFPIPVPLERPFEETQTVDSVAVIK